MLTIRPRQTVYDEAIALAKSDTPVEKSAFYLRRAYMVPWTVNDTTFVLTTSEPTAKHTVNLNREYTISFIPGASQFEVSLPLLKGANRVEVRTASQVGTCNVGATAVETWFQALGRAFYRSFLRDIQEFRDQLSSPLTTLLSGHLLPYSDLFIPSEYPRLHQTKLAISTYLGGRAGFSDGVMRIASALYYCTPHVTRVEDAEYLYPNLYTPVVGMQTSPSLGEVHGRLFDVWSPNVCLASKAALLRLAQNIGSPDVPSEAPFTAVSVDDRQILLRTGEVIDVHRIDPLDVDCSSINDNVICDLGVRAFVDMSSVRQAVLTSPQVPLDATVTRPVNFGFFDSGTFWDESTGGGPGMGGDDSLDTVDEDDLFGTGFLGVSLRGGFDSACLDSIPAYGKRTAKHVYPLASTSGFTPASPVNMPVVVDADAGSPTALGSDVVWVTAPRHWLDVGDRIRTEAPDVDYQVVSAWPVYTFTRKSGSVTVSLLDVTHYTVVGDPGFFEPRHQGDGVLIASEKACIVSVSTDGTTAVVAGNIALPIGVNDCDIYAPARNRQAAYLPGLSGHRLFELQLSSVLTDTIPTGTQLDYRVTPKAVAGSLTGDVTVDVMSDILPLPGDLFYVSPTVSYEVDGAVLLGTEPVTGFPTYRVTLTEPLLADVNDGSALYSVTDNPCFINGDPVTPLTIMTLSPSAYLT